MLRVTDMAHLIVRARLAPGALAVDATVGNGHDTVMLADAVGSAGRVFGFDVQASALAQARETLGARPQVELFEAGHEWLSEHLPSNVHGRISAVMFNLGYLPGGDKRRTTKPDTTVQALSQATALIAIGGIITVLVYAGHAGGADEADAVGVFVSALPAAYGRHKIARLSNSRPNSATPTPELLVIERLP
jgi:predicted methyltransferase